MANERTTEEIVRLHLKKFGIEGQILEEQMSDDPRIRKALAKASKSGDGIGKPEFLLRLKDHPEFIIVVECKADASKHESKLRDKPALYAVDGVLVYSAHLAKDFDVVAIAISGTTANALKVSTFRQLRGQPTAEPLISEHGPINKLVAVAEYRRLLDFDPAVRRRTHDELMAFSRELHNYMREQAKLSENEKPLAVSGCLLALRDDAFKATWRKYKYTTLGRELLAAVRREIEAAIPETEKHKVVLHPYQFLETHPELHKVPQDQTDWPLRQLVSMIEEHVRPFLDTYHDVDVIGQFYGEFLRYAGGDKKGLGIVLTPRHLTELFVKVARVGLNDTVVDTCCGTGGFLIAAMTEMDAKAAGDKKIREDIRKHRLVGVEQQPHMFALVASNMILRGDGKANLFRGSCFDSAVSDQIMHPSGHGRFKRPTVGLINPPFAQKGAGLHELDFTFGLLELLAPHGRVVVVLPLSCAIEPHPTRAKILAKHTLVASLSLPADLFHQVGVITCALVFEAHQPHDDAPTGTWFAAWKDDGFVKQKQKGRIDARGTWPTIRDKWLAAFHGRSVVPGQSVVRHVGTDDEWCAEAYLEPDYAALTRNDFETLVKEYAMFTAIYGAADEDAVGAEE